MTSESRAYHDAHLDNVLEHRRLESAAKAQATYRGNLQSLLTVVDPQPCDFEGCVE